MDVSRCGSSNEGAHRTDWGYALSMPEVLNGDTRSVHWWHGNRSPLIISSPEGVGASNTGASRCLGVRRSTTARKFIERGKWRSHTPIGGPVLTPAVHKGSNNF